jgi:hypothetical protein
MTFVIEDGYVYYLCKLYNRVEVADSTNYVNGTGFGDDFNNFNKVFGSGQTFRFQTGTGFSVDDHKPKAYTLPELGISSIGQVGGVKPRRGVVIDATTGDSDATPVSSDLITIMNTTHFENNVTTGKIDFKTSLIPSTSTSVNLVCILNRTQFENNVTKSKVDIKTNWKPTTVGTADAVPYSGITSIPATWTTTQIPDLGAGKITTGTFATDRIPDLATTKITSGTFDVFRIPDLSTTKITSGTFDVFRIPDLSTTTITSGTFDVLRIPDLGTAKITTGTFDVFRIPDLSTTTITSGTFDVFRIPDLSTTTITSGTFDVLRIPDLATTKITTGTVAGVRIPALDTAKITTGTFVDARIPALGAGKITSGTFVDLLIPTLAISKTSGLQTALDVKQATINSIANQIIIGNGNGATTTNTGLTWTTTTNLLTETNIPGNGSTITSLNMWNAGSGILEVARGGTGRTIFVANLLLIGNNTSTISQDANLGWSVVNSRLSATNFAGNGSLITDLNMGNVGSGTLGVINGGTGGTFFTEGRIPYRNGANALATTTNYIGRIPRAHW